MNDRIKKTYWRIIPARAGFTIHVAISLVVAPDHPRSRGVYTALVDVPEDARGSSPLARGLLQVPVRFF